MISLWDSEYNLEALDSLVEDNHGKDVTLCTVRSPNVLDTKLGNLFWVLLARRLTENHCVVKIYDFPERNYTSSPLITQQLADIFELKNLQVLKAEDHNKNEARKTLQRFSRNYANHPSSYPGLIPSVGEGLLRTKDGRLDPSLERMCEELAIFIEDQENPKAAQMSNHERETVQLLRYLGNPKKHFIHIDLGGIESEFRAERVAKLKDLPTKIILGNGLGKMYNHFNSCVLVEIANALSEIALRAFPKKQFSDEEKGWKYDDERREYLLSKISRLNPNLKTYLAILLEEKGHHFFLDSREYGDELRRATRNISKLENPDYTWVFNHLKKYDVGFGELKSFVIDLTKRAISTVSSDRLLEIGRHFYTSVNSFYGLMFFEEYLRRESKDKIAEVVEVYNNIRGSTKGRRGLFELIRAHDPKKAEELPYFLYQM